MSAQVSRKQHELVEQFECMLVGHPTFGQAKCGCTFAFGKVTGRCKEHRLEQRTTWCGTFTIDRWTREMTFAPHRHPDRVVFAIDQK